MKIDVPLYDDRAVAVIGLSKSGLSTARSLLESGATVECWDDSENARIMAEAAGLTLVSPDQMDPGLVVMSPGVPLTHPKPHPIVAKAKQSGAPIVGDIELLYRAHTSCKFIGITGTNGKSTTTALIAHILESAKVPHQVGGNLGTPALDLESLDSDGVYVLELSSYQLDLLSSAVFNASVLLNITPDHLDRHGGMDGYIAAKEHIFDRQGQDEVGIVSVDDENCEKVYQRLNTMERVVWPFSTTRKLENGVYIRGDNLFDAIDGPAYAAMKISSAPHLQGAHNAQNIAAAFAACRAVGVEAGQITKGIRTFPGLAHRQEIFADLNGLLFVNDSKATNAEAATRALASFDKIYWIAGGREKAGGYDPLIPYLSNVHRAFLIGEAAGSMAEFLEGKADYEICEHLKNAVFKALSLAMNEGAQGAVILLSPACASFDQFTSFEARGDAFKSIVNAVLKSAGGSKARRGT